MRRIRMWIVGTLAIATAAATAYPSGAQPQAPAAAPAPRLSEENVERLADLLRFWTFVRLFHVDQLAMTAEWERALEEEAAQALAAPDDAALAVIARRMLARLQQSESNSARRPAAAPAAAADVPPFRLVSGRPIASCLAIGRAIMSGAQAQPSAAERAAISELGLVFDCRGFGSDPAGFQARFTFSQWFAGAAPSILARSVDRGAMRMRFHDGYPPEGGRTSGGYARGLSDASIGRVETSSGSSGRAPRVAIIADATTPDPSLLAGGLNAAGIGGLVAQGPIADLSTYLFRSKHLRVPVKVSQHVGPDGQSGFRPDACVAADAADEAMVAAQALLKGDRAPACPALPAPAAPASSATVAAAAQPPASGAPPVPSLGQRMVALAKLWGTIEYFFPYASLTERPWSAALEEFIPVFAAAGSRQAYEDAVLRLSQRTDDSHVRVQGVLTHLVSASHVPPVYIRPVGSGFAVAGLHDPALVDRLRIGDELLAVDGRPVADIAAELRPYFAASTPQSLVQRQASHLAAGAKDSEARLSIRRGDGPPVEVIAPRSMMLGLAASEPHTTAPTYSRIGADIGYVDLDRLTGAEVDVAIDTLMDTRAIIFDLRGYPQGTAWALAPRLALDGRQEAPAAQFRRPNYRGPSEPQERWTSFVQRIPPGNKARYRGRVIVLIDDRAISQSEHTALFLKSAANAVFVGSPTTGANGDVTRVELPGQLRVSFTGQDVRHADGRQLQRVGIQPDVAVVPTLAGMRAGRDEVLEAGLREARRAGN